MELDSSFVAEMPQYRSHKIVRALQIKLIAEVVPEPQSTEYVSAKFWLQGRQDPVTLSLTNKPKPEVGWYLIVYDDGRYYSFSPQQPFEDGYTKV